jgi:hypothetical protein
MKDEDRLTAYRAVLAHHAAEVQRGAPRKTHEELLGGAAGALDYDLLAGHAQLSADIGSGDGNRQQFASILEPLYRFALLVSGGHMSVAASVKAAGEAEAKAAAEKAAPTPAPSLPPAPGGLS